MQLTEDSSRGDGFLADVVADWKAATVPAVDAGLRVVLVRTGIVQAAAGGTLRLLRPLFAAGLGGRVAGGQGAVAVFPGQGVAPVEAQAPAVGQRPRQGGLARAGRPADPDRPRGRAGRPLPAGNGWFLALRHADSSRPDGHRAARPRTT